MRYWIVTSNDYPECMSMFLVKAENRMDTIEKAKRWQSLNDNSWGLITNEANVQEIDINDEVNKIY